MNWQNEIEEVFLKLWILLNHNLIDLGNNQLALQLIQNYFLLSPTNPPTYKINEFIKNIFSNTELIKNLRQIELEREENHNAHKLSFNKMLLVYPDPEMNEAYKYSFR